MEVLTLEEIRQRFPDHWLYLETVEEDESGETTRARVIASGKNLDDVRKAGQAFRRANPGLPTEFLFTGPVVDPASNATVVLLCLSVV